MVVMMGDTGLKSTIVRSSPGSWFRGQKKAICEFWREVGWWTSNSDKNTRNSSGDEIANVNFLYDDIVHVPQNTIDSCKNSATDRRGYVLERMCLPNSVN